MQQRADQSLEIVRTLRAKGFASTEIAAILGAAFLTAVDHLPPDLRGVVLTLHVQGIASVFPDHLKTVPLTERSDALEV